MKGKKCPNRNDRLAPSSSTLSQRKAKPQGPNEKPKPRSSNAKARAAGKVGEGTRKGRLRR
eukprot:2972697-Rhodomonas_salina.1